MNKSKQIKALALAVVAMMVLVSAAAMVPAQGMDAAAGDIPQGSQYGYILETNGANITVVNVTVNGEVQTTRGLTQWSYDSNGLGPFNTFYAAVNLADYSTSGAPSEFSTETPLNTGAGQVAYVLDPDNLKQTIKKTTITQGKYNIMLVIPTVYWYSDATNNKLYMSNNPGYFSGTVSSEDMKPWAHTIKLEGGSTVTKDHLMIGVYEGYVDGSSRLTSQSEVIPTASQNIAAFRTNALNNKAAEDSYYGLWNFYQYTLYKMMAFTVMGSMDSQHADGLGEGNVWGQTASSGTGAEKTAKAASMTGDGDTKGVDGSQGWYGYKTDYSSQQAAGKNMNDQYSKVFIENSWGSVTEFVDDVWFNGRSMMVGNNDPSLLKARATSQSNMGLDGTMQSAPATAVSVSSDGMINGASKVSQTWGVPTSSTSSSATGTLQNDKVWSNSGSRCLYVGGAWSDGASAGVGYFDAHNRLDCSNYNIGARLAYLTSAASADYAIKYNVGTGGAVDGPAGGKYGEQVDLTVTPATGYSLATLTYTIGTGSPVDIKDDQHFTIPESTVATEVTVTAVFSKNSYAIAGVAGTNGSVALSPTSISKPYETAISVSGNVITIGSATVTATADTGYSFSSWQFYNNADPENPVAIEQPSAVPAYNIKAVASFTINSYVVTLQKLADVGTVTGDFSPTSMANREYDSAISTNQSARTVTVGDATVTAPAATGYTFVKWTYKVGSGEAQDIIATSKMPASAITLIANYTINTYAVTLVVSTDSGSFDEKISPETIPDQNYNTAISQSGKVLTIGSQVITAPSPEGFTFVNWTFSPALDDGKLPASAVTATANYTINKHNVTLTVSPSGYGTLNVQSVTDVPYGSSITQNNATITINGTLVTATAAEGRLFSSWNVPGSATTMPDNDLAITAVFIADPAQYQVIGSATGGSLSFLGMTTGHTEYMSVGETVQVTLTPDSGKMLQTISAAYSGGSVPMAKSGTFYEFVMPSGATTVTAVFVETGSSIQVTFVDTNAQKSVIIDVDAGEHIMLPTATAPANKVLGGWYSAETGGELYGVAGQYYKPAGDVTMYSRYADSPSGPTMGSFSVSVTKDEHLDVSYSGSIIGGSFGFLSIVPQKNYGYVDPVLTNCTLSRISDNYYIINPDSNLASGSVITIAITETQLDPSGFSEFYVSGIVSSNTAADVVLRSSDNGGLYAGTVTVHGTCYEIRDLQDGKGPRTVYTTFTSSKTVDVAEGDLSLSYEGSFEAPAASSGVGKQTIYWVYAEYSYDSTLDGTADSRVDTVGLLSMPVVTE
jgi:hypothetical protein